MIRYSLTCDKGHGFESWFQSARAYDTLSSGGHVSCAVCGSVTVSKALMAPALRADTAPALADAEGSDAARRAAALAALRRQVEENADYVGLSFAAEARAIHDGDAPERAIYGEAAVEDARKLIEDGIPVAPLPFMPKTRTN
jgi:hypothetical protein